MLAWSPVARFDRATFSGESVAFESPSEWHNVTFECDSFNGRQPAAVLSGTKERG